MPSSACTLTVACQGAIGRGRRLTRLRNGEPKLGDLRYSIALL
jgi:hypothetical protein